MALHSHVPAPHDTGSALPDSFRIRQATNASTCLGVKAEYHGNWGGEPLVPASCSEGLVYWNSLLITFSATPVDGTWYASRLVHLHRTHMR